MDTLDPGVNWFRVKGVFPSSTHAEFGREMVRLGENLSEIAGGVGWMYSGGSIRTEQTVIFFTAEKNENLLAKISENLKAFDSKATVDWYPGPSVDGLGGAEGVPAFMYLNRVTTTANLDFFRSGNAETNSNRIQFATALCLALFQGLEFDRAKKTGILEEHWRRFAVEKGIEPVNDSVWAEQANQIGPALFSLPVEFQSVLPPFAKHLAPVLEALGPPPPTVRSWTDALKSDSFWIFNKRIMHQIWLRSSTDNLTELLITRFLRDNL